MRVLILGTVLALAAGGALAAEPNSAAGEAQFLQTCAPCHGASAAGDGPMAEMLSIAPPDLTDLSEGGVFPIADVVRRIDGRDMLLAHGGPMPLFGYILEDRSAVIDDPDGNPIFTSQAVLDIAAYLESLQR